MKYSFFKNKKIIVTGHTGFKGSWLICWLSILNAQILGISLKPKKLSHFNLIKNKIKIKNVFLDIRNEKEIKKKILDFQPDLVFHLAAQAIVSKSYEAPKYTYETNVLGTFNVLNSLLGLKKKCSAVFITSDKCYQNREINRGYKEDDKMGGEDFYSSSKASAELLIHSFYKSFIYKKKMNLSIATARAGNVIGGGDWSKDRLIPDCIFSWSKGKRAIVRNPNSTRPWQHVLEALNGYLHLSYFLSQNKFNGESFNFSNQKIKNFTVKDFIYNMSKKWIGAKWKIKKNSSFKETKLLQLSNRKAEKKMKWKNKIKLDDTINLVFNWYYSFYKKKKILTFEQIKFFTKLKK